MSRKPQCAPTEAWEAPIFALLDAKESNHSPKDGADRSAAADVDFPVAAPIHPADEGDTTTLSPTLEAAARNLDEVGLAPSEEEPCVAVADKIPWGGG